ncbi:MAG: peptidoglycan-binding domain-containing protein [Ilumatobacteraceae bacterium]
MRRVPILIALATVLASCSSITDPEVAELPEITVGPETTTPSAADTTTTEAPIVLDNTPQAPTAAGSLADYGARLAATALAGPIDTPCGTIAVAAVGPTDPGIVDSRDAPTADLHDLRWNGEAWEPTISPLAEVLWDDSTGNGLIGYGLRGVAIGLVDGTEVIRLASRSVYEGRGDTLIERLGGDCTWQPVSVAYPCGVDLGAFEGYELDGSLALEPVSPAWDYYEPGADPACHRDGAHLLSWDASIAMLRAKSIDDVWCGGRAFAAGIERPVRMCSEGPLITSIQQALADAGQQLSVDGMFGPGTQRAIIAHQQASGLEVTGTITDALENMLLGPADGGGDY